MIKPFLILMLGSFAGNKVMVPSTSYSIEAGIQRKWLSLSLETSYNVSKTNADALFLRSGSNCLVPVIGSITVSPMTRSRLRPYLGVGYGYVMTDRDIDTVQMVGWKEWETITPGVAYQFKGGIEYRAGKHWSVVAGVRQLFFQTQIVEHRQRHPKYEDSLDYQRVHDVDLGGLTGNLGIKFIF